MEKKNRQNCEVEVYKMLLVKAIQFGIYHRLWTGRVTSGGPPESLDFILSERLAHYFGVPQLLTTSIVQVWDVQEVIRSSIQ